LIRAIATVTLPTTSRRPLPDTGGPAKRVGCTPHHATGISVKKNLIILLKVSASLAILAYLVTSAQRNGSFADLWAKPKDWGVLAVAAVCCSSAVITTLIRWGALVRALDLPFTVKDSLRLGFLGYLFNLAPMGVVGGDLLKAGMLAWEHPGNKGKAVASVVVDRVIGLYTLFVLASVAILVSRFWTLPVAGIRWISAMTIVITVVATATLAAILTLVSPDRAIGRWLCNLPRIGQHLENSIDAVRLYRSRPYVLLGAAAASLGVHSLFTMGTFLIFRGLRYEGISLGTHFVIMPLSAATGMVPLSIGPLEVAMEAFYHAVPVAAGVVIQNGQGLIVALGYRIITLLIAAVGVCYYLSSRREVAVVMDEVERQSESLPMTGELASAADPRLGTPAAFSPHATHAATLQRLSVPAVARPTRPTR
jgi:uncharacterized protein (TIRG00374 family)